MSAEPEGPRAVAIIPARGGSKGIPGKNLRSVGGVPLLARAVRTALRTTRVDRVIVSTDDDRLAEAAGLAGAEVVMRPAELARDESSSEVALLHALGVLTEREAVEPITVFIQATSPFVDPSDIDAAVDRVAAGECDVVFSAVETYGFLWRATADGEVGVNHEHSSRPRRQDREPHHLETGAFYVMGTQGFINAGFRFFGRVGVQLVDPRTAIEIDEPADLELASVIAPLLDAPEPIDIDALVMDFDGVHTDNSAIISLAGDEQVRVNRSDGLGIELLRKSGLPMIILSTEQHPVVTARAAKLRLAVMHGLDDKAAQLQRWCVEQGFDLNRVAYVGNDVNDLACLRLVGWPVVVADAHPDVRAEARLVLDHDGGHGAIRELADRILRARTGRTHATQEQL